MLIYILCMCIMISVCVCMYLIILLDWGYFVYVLSFICSINIQNLLSARQYEVL